MPARAAIYSRSQAYTNAISSANAATVTSANKTSAISHSLSLPKPRGAPTRARAAHWFFLPWGIVATLAPAENTVEQARQHAKGWEC